MNSPYSGVYGFQEDVAINWSEHKKPDNLEPQLIIFLIVKNKEIILRRESIFSCNVTGMLHFHQTRFWVSYLAVGVCVCHKSLALLAYMFKVNSIYILFDNLLF